MCVCKNAKKEFNDRKVEPAASSRAHSWRVQESQTRPTPFGLVRRRQPYKLVFPSRPPYRRHEPYQLLTPHAAEHHKRQCDEVSHARLLRLRQLKCTAGFSLGEQHGNHTRSTARGMRSYVCQLLIRSRPSSVGSVSQIGRRSVSPVYPSGSF